MVLFPSIHLVMFSVTTSMNKTEGDDLFGELDDMLADLNAQLNIIIPTSN